MSKKINDITTVDNPILNNPYSVPQKHYSTDSQGNLDYSKPCTGRRIYKPYILPIPIRHGRQREILEWNADVTNYNQHLINLCRAEVSTWRGDNYPNTTRISKELLTFWFANPERESHKKLFFAQQEAIETAIWINEVATKSNPGQNILRLLQQAHKTTSNRPEDQLPRIAFKMATGTGKTVVMACLILYHFFNRREYGNDTRFVDNFLIVAPGVTIKDRLGVLYVGTNKGANSEDYYHARGLVPQHKEPILTHLNANLVIINYHAFEPKTLQGNKRSPFDGKVDLEGKKIDTGNKENFSQVVKRLLSNFKSGSRLLVLNDEAHHCYLPKSDKKTLDNEEDENARAAVWFSGLRELATRFTVQHIYDLSATPYYLNGSGYTAYSLFPWVVSDFGLIEAIESGLVKIPYLPESDTSQELTMPVLRNLYEHVKGDLPKKGQRKKHAEANAAGTVVTEKRPDIPPLIKLALDQFYNHYVDYDKGLRRKPHEANQDLFSAPPVFIIVCNNTSVSKEVYKYVAGYEVETSTGEIQVVSGAKEVFSNYDLVTNQPLKKPPTLLIDSAALEDSEQISDEFKKIFASEIAEFKKDYAQRHGQVDAENVTAAQILREVVNTVGKPGKLGAHIRCVVSVSMLTEGWDSNTVTHIMGLRAFGSQLLCEQVAGRALRRMEYFLQGYDKKGNPTSDKRKIVVEKFPPEYAHIIGVPFQMFKGGDITITPSIDCTHIRALPERRALEITFPNISGYRLENYRDEIRYDFRQVNDYDIICSQLPLETTLASAFSAREETMQVKNVFAIREQEIQFLLTKELILLHFSDEDRNPKFQYFNKLLEIVKYWYAHKVQLFGERDEKFKKLLWFDAHKKAIDYIMRGINTQLNTTEYVRPVFNYYNPFSSTQFVNGNTIKQELYATKKSHVNVVVMDSEWEGIVAKTLEQLECVDSYVKNHFLGFAIPYSKDGIERQYFPDFIARVKASDGTVKNLIIEISGMSQDKAEKKWFVENRWLPAVNAVRGQHGFAEWFFIEIAMDIRDIKQQLESQILRI